MLSGGDVCANQLDGTEVPVVKKETVGRTGKTETRYFHRAHGGQNRLGPKQTSHYTTFKSRTQVRFVANGIGVFVIKRE